MSSIAELAKKEGGYQPILVHGEVIFKGWRSCKDRWDQIKPHLLDGQTIVDIGSHYGYFVYEVANAYPDSFVWSLEGGARRADIQKLMLEANELQNVVLSQHMYDLDSVRALLSSYFMGDVILMLSVAHYFDPDEMEEIIAGTAQLAPTLIIEFPSKQEGEVAKREIVQNTNIHEILLMNYDTVEVIGEGSSPKHFDVGRTIYKASKKLIERDKVSYRDGRWHITKKGKLRGVPGISLEELRPYENLYPEADEMLAQAAHMYRQIIDLHSGKVTDINIRNVIKGSGLHIIDWQEGLDNPFIYDMPMKDYTARTMGWDAPEIYRQFVEMWNGTWKP